MSNLSGIGLDTLASTPSNVFGTDPRLVQPNKARAVYVGNGAMDYVYVRGDWSCAQYVVGDHFTTRFCNLGGWAAIAQGCPQITGGDNSWYGCTLSANSVGVYVTDQQFAGFFERCHFGLKSVGFYVNTSTANLVALLSLVFMQCGFEGGGRGFFLNPQKTATFRDLSFFGCNPSGNVDGQIAVNPTARATSASSATVSDVAYSSFTAGPFIQCGTLENLNLSTDDGFPGYIGYDRTAGCLIDSTTVRERELGNISTIVAAATAYGVPVIRAAARRDVYGLVNVDRTQE
jgi:hypothetical protein